VTWLNLDEYPQLARKSRLNNGSIKRVEAVEEMDANNLIAEKKSRKKAIDGRAAGYR
jgi:hypothetical protein